MIFSNPGLAQIRITDDLGHTSSFAAPPQRIVTLLPSLAESVCALGRCERIVGIDRYTDVSAFKLKPQTVGGGLDPNIEAIVALKPDVVLMATSARAQDRLRALGVPVLSLEPKTHADVKRALDRLDALLQPPPAQRANAVWLGIQAQLDRAAARVPAASKGQRTYFEVGSAPWAAGPASFIGETLARLGAANIVPAELGVFPQISPEFVVKANPRIIVVNAKNKADLLKRPGWLGIDAVRLGQVCALSPTEVDTVSRAGPRMGDAAERIAECLGAPKP